MQDASTAVLAVDSKECAAKGFSQSQRTAWAAVFKETRVLKHTFCTEPFQCKHHRGTICYSIYSKAKSALRRGSANRSAKHIPVVFCLTKRSTGKHCSDCRVETRNHRIISLQASTTAPLIHESALRNDSANHSSNPPTPVVFSWRQWPLVEEQSRQSPIVLSVRSLA
jgi:hypothetical protein